MSMIKRMKIFLYIFEIVLVIIASLFIYLGLNVNTTSVVYIPKGNIGKIISYLNKRDFDVSKNFDKYLLVIFGRPQAGWINMKETSLSKGDFLHRLTTAKAATKGVVVYPGETTEMVLRMLAKEYSLPYVELRAAYNLYAPFSEGVIIPETYSIPIGISARHLIGYLLNVSNSTYESMSKKIFKNYDEKKWKQYLVIASIIQKEAGNSEEMPLISSVIYNRLKKGMRLQMDGALNYGEYSHVPVTPKRIDEDNTRYNTYKHYGLPPSPVCLISAKAIQAAIFPKRSNFLYFVRDKNSKTNGHIFTKTYNEHIKEINKLR